MKSKKGLISFIFLLIVAGIVFFIGWVQFYIPIGKYGVLVSKTSGVYDKPLTNGALVWRWERLLPTNTKLYTFSATPKTFYNTISGELPSSSIYGKMLAGNPQFNYSITVESTISINPKDLPSLVKINGITDEIGLENYLNQQAQILSSSVIQYVLNYSTEKAENIIELSINTQQILDGINVLSKFPNIVISTVSLQNIVIPDLSLYNLAKKSYEDYQTESTKAMTTMTTEESVQAAADYLQIQRFGNLGKVLTDYPILIDFLAVSRENAADAFDILKNVRAQ